jgi:hypothetical protein
MWAMRGVISANKLPLTLTLAPLSAIMFGSEFIIYRLRRLFILVLIDSLKRKIMKMEQKVETSTEAAIVGNNVLADTVKSDWDLRKCFEQLRFDKNHHLGLGDIRLTIAQQEEICELVERFYRCR